MRHLNTHSATVKFPIRTASRVKSIYQHFESPPRFDPSALLRGTIALQRSSISASNQEEGECRRGSRSFPRIPIPSRRRLWRTGSRVVFFPGGRAARSDYWRIHKECERRWSRGSNRDKGGFRVDELANANEA